MTQRKRAETQKAKPKSKAKPSQKAKPKRKAGAPEFAWTKELVEELFFDVSTTPKSIYKILSAKKHYPSERTFYKKLLEDKRFSQRYDQAKIIQQDVKIESQDDVLNEVLEKHTYIDKDGNVKIDSAAVALYKIKVDTIKWEAARLGRIKWGDSQPETDKSIQSIKEGIARLADSKNPHEKDY